MDATCRAYSANTKNGKDYKMIAQVKIGLSSNKTNCLQEAKIKAL